MRKIGSPMVAAVESVWTRIQARHGDAPDVVVAMAGGSNGRGRGVRLGKFGPRTWEHGPLVMPELFVGGEGLAAGAPEVLATVLHYAAHAIADARQVKDTSRGGAYHNGKYKTIAEELGLAVDRVTGRGWARTTLADRTAEHYRDELAVLERALVAHRRSDDTAADTNDDADTDDRADDGGDSGQRAPRGGRAMVCRCDPVRRVRAYKKTIDAGPILCGICRQPFHVDLSSPED